MDLLDLGTHEIDMMVQPFLTLQTFATSGTQEGLEIRMSEGHMFLISAFGWELNGTFFASFAQSLWIRHQSILKIIIIIPDVMGKMIIVIINDIMIIMASIIPWRTPFTLGYLMIFLLMISHLVFIIESFITGSTTEWKRVRMDQTMHFEFIQDRELFAANSTFQIRWIQF